MAYLVKINRLLKSVGINLNITLKGIRGWPSLIRDYFQMRKELQDNRDFKHIIFYPITHEKSEASGKASGHYFHQDLLVARKIFLNSPKKHVDIGSRIDGFVAHVATFREIEVFDIRSQVSKVKNISFVQADLTKLPEGMVNYCDSISSLHAIEHFGLGRYSDNIDVNGHIKAISSISNILKKGGLFYFSTPIGWQRIEFNAHRVFDIEYLLKLFETDFSLESFSYVDDNGDLHETIELDEISINDNLNCEFGCGIFELRKK